MEGYRLTAITTLTVIEVEAVGRVGSNLRATP
jgi:hypothetical protein